MRYNLSEMYVDDEIQTKVIDVLDSGRYIKGEENKNFEKEFSEYCNAKFGITTSSGTAALYLAYCAIGLGEGDEIIAPSHTFIATVSPAMHLGAKPIFVDINPETFCMDVEEVEKKITEKTKVIVPVHLYGHPVDMKPIMELAEEHGIWVIEDACQAHGAMYHGDRVGSIGDIGVFSFFPSKNMTVAGDGGMVVTDNEEIAEKIAMLRDQGRTDKYTHELLGFNFRMSEIHAAIGRLQLRHLDEWIDKRRQVARCYNDLLCNLDSIISLPIERPSCKHIYYVYTMRCWNRDHLAASLKGKGIATGLYYPIPLHKQPCVHSKVKLPVTEKIVDEIISLPIHPQLNDNEVEYICDKIKEGLLKQW